MKKLQYLVAGGAGFIGSHLCEELLKLGHRVICMDNFLTGTPSNIERLRNHAGFKLIEHNIVETIRAADPVDYILNLASPASPIDYAKHGIHTMKVGSIGTLNLLGLAREKKAKFLLASTSEVYGDPEIHPQREDYWGNVNPIGPRSVYDEAKRFAEALTVVYAKTHGVDTRIVRIFNTYGPRMRLEDGRAIPAFISQSIRGEEVTVFGDGTQTRSFCYVDDLVRGILKLCETEFHEPVNLGNPNEMTLDELAKAVIRLTGSKSKIVHRPLPQDDPRRRKPDISRAKKVLSWEPKVKFEDGLRTTIEWFRSVIKPAKFVGH
ncbi:MAG: SDR family oxidoreductase [Candidatus Omnitrophica bacterium]|nr:SDR family oxidoreductase [Candidatus Omnitrophota bacterium]